LQITPTILLGLLTLLGRAAPGADFFEFKERRATDTGCLLARSNAEIGKIGPGRRVAVKIGPYFVVVLA